MTGWSSLVAPGFSELDSFALGETVAACGARYGLVEDFGLPGSVRVTVGSIPLMERVDGELRDVCESLRRGGQAGRVGDR